MLAEQYGPDDNRYDMRPFLYPNWEWANRKIERSLAAMGDLATKKPDIKRD